MPPEQAKVLVVDDRPENLLAFRTMLDDLGQELVTAQSGEEALKYLLENDVAVVLLDVNMPRMDGLETAEFIRRRKRSAHTPIIFLTAYVEEMHTVKGYSLGAVDYIMTPVMPDILRSKVKVFIQLFLMTRAVERQADQRIQLAREQTALAAAEESVRRTAFLAQVSDLVGNSLDIGTTVKALTQFIVPFLADFCALVLLDASGRPGCAELMWSADGLPEKHTTASVVELTDPRIKERLATKDTQVITAIEPGWTSVQGVRQPRAKSESIDLGFTLRSLVVLPLVAHDRRLGVLVLGSAQREPNPTRLALAEEVATRTAVALDNCQLYAKIQEADQRKNEFLAMLSHELRNPLAPLRNAIQVLRMPALKTTEREWAMDVVDRQTKHLMHLVDDLLDVARVTQGKITLQIETVEVVSVMNLAIEISRPLIDAQRHELTLTMPEGPLHIRADFSRVAQVLANLLNNAAKYTNAGGSILLSAKAENAEVVFRVRDSGMGIPQHLVSSIFDLFVQADRSLDRSQGGLGIGLTIAQRLVQMQDGSIEAHSGGAGQGSEFIVRLPRASNAETPEMPKPINSEVTPHRILVVDDYADAAESMAAVLRAESHQVHIACDGPDAIEVARRVHPNVILLDIGLPGMNGFEVARALRAIPETRESTLIAVTGYGRTEDQQKSKEASFNYHLVKPIDLLELDRILRTAKRPDPRSRLCSVPTAA